MVVPGGLESPQACPRGLAANAKVSHGGLSLVNTCMSRGGDHYFQELPYGGLKLVISRGVRLLNGIAHSTSARISFICFHLRSCYWSSTELVLSQINAQSSS